MGFAQPLEDVCHDIPFLLESRFDAFYDFLLVEVRDFVADRGGTPIHQEHLFFAFPKDVPHHNSIVYDPPFALNHLLAHPNDNIPQPFAGVGKQTLVRTLTWVNNVDSFVSMLSRYFVEDLLIKGFVESARAKG